MSRRQRKLRRQWKTLRKQPKRHLPLMRSPRPKSSAVDSVHEKYCKVLYYGNYTDEVWQKYIDELKVAGIDEFPGAYQDQLNAWKAANQ